MPSMFNSFIDEKVHGFARMIIPVTPVKRMTNADIPNPCLCWIRRAVVLTRILPVSITGILRTNTIQSGIILYKPFDEQKFSEHIRSTLSQSFPRRFRRQIHQRNGTGDYWTFAIDSSKRDRHLGWSPWSCRWWSYKRIVWSNWVESQAGKETLRCQHAACRFAIEPSHERYSHAERNIHTCCERTARSCISTVIFPGRHFIWWVLGGNVGILLKCQRLNTKCLNHESCESIFERISAHDDFQGYFNHLSEWPVYRYRQWKKMAKLHWAELSEPSWIMLRTPLWKNPIISILPRGAFYNCQKPNNNVHLSSIRCVRYDSARSSSDRFANIGRLCFDFIRGIVQMFHLLHYSITAFYNFLVTIVSIGVALGLLSLPFKNQTTIDWFAIVYFCLHKTD